MSAELVNLVRPAAGEPEGALVLLHGRGTSEHDLFPLLDALDPERRLLGVTPRAPYSMPPGGAHWYGPVLRVGYPNPETFYATYALLGDWLERLGQPLERTVIGGFSQGAVMSHALALGPGRRAPAGLIALSGFMPRVDGFELDLDDRAGFPVAIGHGTHDPIIGVEWGHEARDRLETAGADVLWRESPMPHSVDPAFVDELRGWVADRFAPSRQG
jgi:phospholipase/carboxylesterase